MNPRILVVMGAALLGGCVRDLPEGELGEAARLLFRDFDDDPAALPAHLAVLDAALDGVDLEASAGDRLVDLPELSSEYFGGADVPAGLDTNDQMRAGMSGRSAYSVADNLAVQVEVNFTCANARSVKCHERLPADGSDAGAFLDGTSDVYRTENTVRLQTLPIDFWIQAPVDFRWVVLDDGRAAAVGRTWIRRPFDNDSGKRTWEQRFGVDVFLEDPKDPGATRRFYGTWLGPEVNGLQGAFVQPAIRRGLDDGFTRPDAFLDDGGTCDVDLKACLEDAPF